MARAHQAGLRQQFKPDRATAAASLNHSGNPSVQLNLARTLQEH
ncbi:hypothetical protein [Leisingera sp. S132]|nr:hypothetical protein [Leisingera sp. S132]